MSLSQLSLLSLALTATAATDQEATDPVAMGQVVTVEEATVAASEATLPEPFSQDVQFPITMFPPPTIHLLSPLICHQACSHSTLS